MSDLGHSRRVRSISLFFPFPLCPVTGRQTLAFRKAEEGLRPATLQPPAVPLKRALGLRGAFTTGPGQGGTPAAEALGW